MKKAKKLIAVICAVALFTGVLSTVGLAASTDVDYDIISPYANVDWSGNAKYDVTDPRTYFSTMGKRKLQLI